MTITTVFAANDGRIVTNNASYATAAAGGGASTQTTEASGFVGQSVSGGVRFLHQLFFEFDTSAIDDADVVSNVVFSLDGVVNNSTTDFNMIVLNYDWSSGGLTTGDWQTPTQLGALNQLATFNSSGYTTAYMNFASIGTAFDVHINKTGSTFFMVASDRNISATDPPDSENLQVRMSETSGTTQDPKLVVTHAAAGGGVPRHFMNYQRLRRAA